MVPFSLQRGQLGRGRQVSVPLTATPTFANMVLLLHANARPFIDSSPNKRAVANYLSKCGISAGKITFSETAAGLMVAGHDTDWQFGTGNWFISARVSNSTYPTQANIFDTRPSSGSSSGWSAGVNTSRQPFITIEGTTYGTGTPAANLLATSSTECTISFSYNGSSLRCFVNGVLSWSQSVSLNIDTGALLMIGNRVVSAQPTTDGSTTMTLREVLIVKGEAVAVASFTEPPAWVDTGTVIESWNPVTYSNVKWNCHMSGTNGGTTFTDTSTGAKTVTRAGNAQTSTAQFRIGSSSGLFDGTGDFLTVPDSADWDFGTGDFSFEVQIRPANITSRQVVLANYQDSTTGWSSQINLTSNGRWHVNLTGDGSEFDSGSGIGSSYLPILATTWQHIAVSRINGWLQIFYEGELVFTVADTQNITGSGKALFFGRLTDVSTTVDFNGHAQELRVIKGEGYLRSFIVQTSAHPDS